MAPRTKFYWTDADSGNVITVVFDAVTSMTPEDTVSITDHPVEVGADVTDHARSNSGRLTLECIMSMVPNALDDDTSIQSITVQPVLTLPGGTKQIPLTIPPVPIQFSESGLLQAGIGAISKAFSGAPKATVNAPRQFQLGSVTMNVLKQASPRNRVRDIYDILLKVKDDHSLITVLTAHRDHFDMMIERLAEPRTTSDGTSAKFQIDLKQIRTVSSSQVQAPKPVEPRAQPKVNKGSQTPKPADNPADKESIAAGFSGFGGGQQDENSSHL